MTPEPTTPPTTDRVWWTATEAAAYLRCSRSTLYRKVGDGVLTAHRPWPGARQALFDPDELASLVEQD